MKKHVKIYLEENGYDVCDVIMCEMPNCGQLAVDIHHVSPRGMGGNKSKDANENLIALDRDHHDQAESSEITKDFLFRLEKERIDANFSSCPRNDKKCLRFI